MMHSGLKKLVLHIKDAVFWKIWGILKDLGIKSDQGILHV